MGIADQAKRDLKEVLPDFSGQSRKRLQELISSPDFGARIPPAEVKAIAANEGKSVDALMLSLLPLARTLSRPPISQYLVGAVALAACVARPGSAWSWRVDPAAPIKLVSTAS